MGLVVVFLNDVDTALDSAFDNVIGKIVIIVKRYD